MDFPDGFLGFAREALVPLGLSPAAHHKLLIAKLQDVANGDVKRLTIQMPPGSAKSTYASMLFPVYWFVRRPRSQVMAIGHTASLASYFSRTVRDSIAIHGGGGGLRLAAGRRLASQFKLDDGSEYFATGVRGPITGRHADLILIDDPIKTWADAESPTQRDALWDWYRGALFPRLKPNGSVVVIMTRWHQDDFVGRLLGSRDRWSELRLPAIAEEKDPLGRPQGAALWPDNEDLAAIEQRRVAIGERAFAALYQQAPRPRDYAYFDVDKIVVADAEPEIVRTVRAWDLAASTSDDAGDPDWTVGLKLGATPAGKLIVIDILRIRKSPGQIEQIIADVARRDGVSTLVALPQDPGQAGKAQVDYLKRRLSGYRVVSSPESGAKTVRAMPAAATIDCGNLAVLVAPWNRVFVSELANFPDGPKDDQVDALARAVMSITTSTTSSRRLNIPLIGR